MEIKNFLSRAKEMLLESLFPKGITCNYCGNELNDDEREFSLCQSCAKTMSKIDVPIVYEDIRVYAGFDYDGIVRKYILLYKDSDKPYLCEYIAKYMYNTYKEFSLQADCVTFVPSSPSSKKRRGYDGMEYVAESFAKLSGLPLQKCLARHDGKDQTKVDIKERKQNVKDVFYSTGQFQGKVLLIDDVVTTGSTLTSCGKAIMQSGAESVIYLTFASAKH